MIYRDEPHVQQVLLADGWHRVLRESFDIGDYAPVEASPHDPLGFCFLEVADGAEFEVVGPMTAILALRTNARAPGTA